MVVCLEIGQVLVNVVDQFVEVGCVVGVYVFVLDCFCCCQWFVGSLLGVDYVESCVGWIFVFCLVLCKLVGDYCFGCLVVEDQEWYVGFFCDVVSGLVLILFQVGGIDYYWIVGLEDFCG